MIIPHLNFEVKENIIYTQGYVDDWGLKSQLRMGFFGWGEVSFACSFNYYRNIAGTDDLYLDYYRKKGFDVENLDLNNPRLSYIEPKLKFKILTMGKWSDLVSYIKYRKYFGSPIIVEYPEDGRDPNAIAVTSPSAKEGHDMTLGFVTKVFLYHRRNTTILIMCGTEVSYLWDKNWMEDRRERHFMPVVTVSPELISMRKWMLQIENRFEYWVQRGWHYEVLPGIRWEIQPRTIFEIGVGLPIVGGNVRRYFVGFSYEFGKSQIKRRRYKKRRRRRR